ncbi:MAG: proteasome accessory factor PafA2 family protein [Armatimonadetes bacterium]|nr:proteasome accessory factor PafA2 family protein [Armatimonadota bacterium]
MTARIFGLETEFGCLVHDPSAGTPEDIVEAIKDYAFYDKRIGLIDLHARDYAFEPARSGGFLANGARLYVDSVGSHEEYATPECDSLVDLVAHEKAGQRILQDLLKDLGLAGRVSFHNNSVDHFGGHTFGCHENYLVKGEDYFFKESLAVLLPFLATRQIFAGAGRVGGHRLVDRRSRDNIMSLTGHIEDFLFIDEFYGVATDPSVSYQLSQRADHIVKAVSSRVRFNRALINPKWDSYYTFSDFHRLHILFGEANMSEYATALKIGTTRLVLDLLEIGRAPREVEIRDPIRTLRSISRDASYRWILNRLDGSTITAIDLQRVFLREAQEFLRGRDEETDWVLKEWEDVLDGLEEDPMRLSDRLDWTAKKRMLETYMESEGSDWNDDTLHSLDLEYHNVDPDNGLYYALEQEQCMQRFISEETIQSAMRNAPTSTRAHGRSVVVKRILSKGLHRYLVDWDIVAVDDDRLLGLTNPFHNYHSEAEMLVRRI